MRPCFIGYGWSFPTCDAIVTALDLPSMRYVFFILLLHYTYFYVRKEGNILSIKLFYFTGLSWQQIIWQKFKSGNGCWLIIDRLSFNFTHASELLTFSQTKYCVGLMTTKSPSCSRNSRLFLSVLPYRVDWPKKPSDSPIPSRVIPTPC